MKTLEVTAAIIRQNGKFLICQRSAEKNCGLLWEFPGGKIEAGENGEQRIVRECQEELGIALSVERKLTDIKYPTHIVRLHFYLCSIAAGVPEKKEHNALVWITHGEIDQHEFCPADKEFIRALSKKERG